MICKKLLLLLVLFLGHILPDKEGFAHKAKERCTLCSPATKSKTESNAVITERRARNVDIGTTANVTIKRRKQWTEIPHYKHIENFDSTSQYIQDRKWQGLKHKETEIDFKDKNDRVLSYPESNTKPAFINSKTKHLLQKRTFVSAPPKDNGKISEHDIHLSETILSALKLILDKRNSFQNESEALRLASVLLMKKDDESQPKVARTKGAIRSKMKLPIPATKGMEFVADLLSGATTTRGSLLNARKSSIMTDLVDPTELGVSILRLLFGPQAALVTKPKYKTLFDRISAKSNNQDVQSDSGNVRGNYILARPTLSRIREGGLKPIVRPEQSHSSLSNSHERSFNLAKSVSQLIANLNRKDYAQHKRVKPLFHKSALTSSNMLQLPAKINVDVSGRRKSWVLLKIPKGDNAMKSEQEDDTSPNKSDSNDADSNNNDVSIIGKVHPTVTTSEPQSSSPSKNPNLKEIAEDLGVPQHDDSSGSSVSSKIQSTASQPEQSTIITNKLVQTVQKFLKALQSSIKALQNNKLASSDKVPILEPKSSRPTASVPIAAAMKSRAERPSVATTRQLENEKEMPLEKMRASLRGRDPLSGVLTPDEPITVPSPAATVTNPRLDENVLFQSDTVLGTARDVTDSAKMKEDLEAFAEKGLQAHNRFRTLHHAPNLRWSDALANQAEKLAYEMAMKGEITRSDAPISLDEGENIAKISRVPFEEAGSFAAEVWYSERKNYSYSYPRLDKDNDAFTQMVWKSTKELGMGCAKDLQTNDMYVVALYRPAGNKKRLLRDNVLKEGEVGRDVYATIFKKDKTEKPNI